MRIDLLQNNSSQNTQKKFKYKQEGAKLVFVCVCSSLFQKSRYEIRNACRRQLGDDVLHLLGQRGFAMNRLIRDLLPVIFAVRKQIQDHPG